MPFHDQPGMLYVVATLLPLASFVLLLLIAGLRAAFRPMRDNAAAASLYQALGGDAPGRTGAYIATAAIGLAFVLSLAGFIMYWSEHIDGHQGHGASAHASEGEKAKEHRTPSQPSPDSGEGRVGVWSGSRYWAWIDDGQKPGMALRLGYHIDGLAVTMFLMITLVAGLIHVYSIGYMSEELQETVEDHQAHVRRRGRFPRFFMYLSLFCFSMLNLVLADNLFQVFISWELVGLCSYLLIGFYYERRSAANASNKAFITNRVGDAGFIIGMLILWTYVGSFSFDDIFQSIRSPAKDGHNRTMPHAHQIVRVQGQEVQRDDKTWWVADEQGSHVILFPAHSHVPQAGKTKTPEEGKLYYPGTQGHPHGAGSKAIPYWLLVVAGIGLFLGCVGKSAQFPLQVWLPDAMEGPTPVSALIHAATMVAAGVYLVGRAFPLFAPEVLLIIAYVGAITLFVAATIAILQTDIKKVLAYSTVSQLGFMMLALGVGGWVAGLFHLLTHAFFKALLFLCSGSVIYGCHHEQEMTRMGGLYPKMKVTALTMLVGVLAIAGTPLFSGWYSKDAILVSSLSFASLNPQHWLLFLLPLLTAGITAFYMFRLWFMTFTGVPRDEHVYEHAHESPRVMTIPLIVLAVFSVIVAWGLPPWDVQGSFLEHGLHHEQPEMLKYERGLHLSAVTSQIEGNDFKQESLLYAISPLQPGSVAGLRMGPHDIAGLLALLSAGIGVALAFVVYYFGVLDPADAKAQFPGIYAFLWNKWYFDELYSAAVVRPALVIAGWCRWFDTRVIDGIVDSSARLTVLVSSWDGRFDLGIIDGLVNLTARVIFGVGSWLRVFQTGLIRNYVLFLALAAVGIFAVLSYVFALAG